MLEKYYSGKTCERFYSQYDKEEAIKSPEFNGMCYKQEVEDHVCYKKDDTSESIPKNDDGKSIEENSAKLSILFGLCGKYSLFRENSGPSSTTNKNYCPPNGGYSEKLNYKPVLKAEKLCSCNSLISTIALLICVTILGTIFLTFFLSEVIKAC